MLICNICCASAERWCTTQDGPKIGDGSPNENITKLYSHNIIITKERGSFTFPQVPTSSDRGTYWQVDPKGHKVQQYISILFKRTILLISRMVFVSSYTIDKSEQNTRLLQPRLFLALLLLTSKRRPQTNISMLIKTTYNAPHHHSVSRFFFLYSLEALHPKKLMNEFLIYQPRGRFYS